LDLWCFDVFALNRVTEDHSLRTIVFELFTRHNLNSRFKIPSVFLTTLLDALEAGYGKYRNPYHNQVHAADVTQTVHCFLLRTGMLVRGRQGGSRGGPGLCLGPGPVVGGQRWSCWSRGCLLPRRHRHLATALSPWQWHQDDGDRVTYGLGGGHRWAHRRGPFPRIDKSKVLSLLLHAADISHPTKQWSVHSRWTKALMEEFFRQGDKEAELGLPFSPLCDRTSTLVAQSQIGFIDFIVEPTFSVLTDVAEKMVLPLAEDRTKAKGNPAASQQASSQWRQTSLDEHLELGDVKADLAGFRSTWAKYIQENKQKWKERAASGITNQASIEELSPCEEQAPPAPGRHKQNGDVE
ncbi:PDE1B phosphodiesterase, partial [Glareola pratincola]|nr:PDE1B phosphodiesterase [Glareola pratincola]